jgi:hypothetical protein
VAEATVVAPPLAAATADSGWYSLEINVRSGSLAATITHIGTILPPAARLQYAFDQRISYAIPERKLPVAQVWQLMLRERESNGSTSTDGDIKLTEREAQLPRVGVAGVSTRPGVAAAGASTVLEFRIAQANLSQLFQRISGGSSS